MAYTKTNWNENTPITADKLNKIETGIANGIDKTEQIMVIPITNPEGFQQFRWTNSNYDTVSWTRDATQRKALEVFNESTPKQLLLLSDDGHLTTAGNMAFKNFGTGGNLNANIHNLALHAKTGDGQVLNVGEQGIYVGNTRASLTLESNTTPNINIGGTAYQLYHTGNFNPATKLDAGNFSISNRDLNIYGKRAMVGFNTADGNYLSINYDRDFAAGVRIYGLTLIDSIETGGKLAFSSIGTGGGLHANIHNLALHANTGNGQMMTADNLKIYVGNPSTALAIESNTTPDVKVGNSVYKLYHTGNKPTANDVGALPIGGGTLTGRLYVSGNSKTIGMGTGESDVFINNSRSGKYLQLKDDGTLSYDNKAIYHTGNKPTAGDIGALPLSGGTMTNTLYMQTSGQTKRRIAAIASHGGTDLGDTSARTTIQSNQVPTWWNGNKNRAMLVFDTENPSDYIVRCGAGLGGAAGYITFSW